MCAWRRAATTLTATYNDLEGVRKVFEANKGEIAGIILEPVVGNSGFIAPTQEFLQVRAALFSGTQGLPPSLGILSVRDPLPCASSRGLVSTDAHVGLLATLCRASPQEPIA